MSPGRPRIRDIGRGERVLQSIKGIGGLFVWIRFVNPGTHLSAGASESAAGLFRSCGACRSTRGTLCCTLSKFSYLSLRGELGPAGLGLRWWACRRWTSHGRGRTRRGWLGTASINCFHAGVSLAHLRILEGVENVCGGELLHLLFVVQGVVLRGAARAMRVQVVGHCVYVAGNPVRGQAEQGRLSALRFTSGLARAFPGFGLMFRTSVCAKKFLAADGRQARQRPPYTFPTRRPRQPIKYGLVQQEEEGTTSGRAQL